MTTEEYLVKRIVELEAENKQLKNDLCLGFKNYNENLNKNLKVLLLDQGKFAKNRVCPMNKNKIPCVNCNPCNIMAGYGGAGTFSDGKLNFVPKLGKSDLLKYMNEEEANTLIDDTEKIFKE